MTLDPWFDAMPGEALLAMEQEQLVRLIESIFGAHFVQIGGPSDRCIVHPAITQHVVMGCHFNSRDSDIQRVQLGYDELPLQPNSVDAIVLWHALERAKEPQVLLQEASEALLPHGQLIVVGFNPMSAFGYAWSRRFAAARGQKLNLSWPYSVRRWFRSQGFRIVVNKTFAFRPPVKTLSSWRRALALEAVGQTLFPGFGSVYLLSAVKDGYVMQAEASDWWRGREPIRNGFVEPTSFVSKHE